MISRREAFRVVGMGAALGAVSAGAVCAAVPSADTFVSRMAAHGQAVAAFNLNEDDSESEPSQTLCKEIRAGQVAITSTAGALLALRRLAELDCIIDDEGQCMVEAVMAYLSRRVA